MNVLPRETFPRTPSLPYPDRALLSIPIMQMTARVLESLEDKDSTAFAAACESLWGNDPSPKSSPEEDPMPVTTKEVPGIENVSQSLLAAYPPR